jgi:methionyl-tRNA synthetase
MARVRQRAEQQALQAQEQEGGQGQQMISYERFQELDLRVGRVLDADRVEGADKLLKLTVDLGEEQPRTLVAGVAQQFGPRELIGQNVVVVANLEPATIHGVQSQGMILAAGEKEPVALIVADRDCQPGEKVS